MSSYTTRSDSLNGPVFLLAAVFAGCAAVGHSDIGDIQRKPTSEWTDDDCRTIIIEASSNNVYDDRARIKVFATPFSPLPITALTRLDQISRRWSDNQFEHSLEDRLLDELGVLYDIKTKSYFDKHGKPYQNVQQMDSLIFLVNLKNTTWPCISPIHIASDYVYQIYGRNMSDWPCNTPDISKIHNEIYLENDKGRFLRPNVVWGRRNSILTRDENLLVMFQLRSESYDFLSGSQKFYLNISGLGEKIHLEFPISKIQ